MAINDSFDLREQGATAECEVFVCGERRDREIKLVQRVLSRKETKRPCCLTRFPATRSFMNIIYACLL